jgi:hypothetical protein
MDVFFELSTADNGWTPIVLERKSAVNDIRFAGIVLSQTVQLRWPLIAARTGHIRSL